MTKVRCILKAEGIKCCMLFCLVCFFKRNNKDKQAISKANPNLIQNVAHHHMKAYIQEHQWTSTLTVTCYHSELIFHATSVVHQQPIAGLSNLTGKHHDCLFRAVSNASNSVWLTVNSILSNGACGMVLASSDTPGSVTFVSPATPANAATSGGQPWWGSRKQDQATTSTTLLFVVCWSVACPATDALLLVVVCRVLSLRAEWLVECLSLHLHGEWTFHVSHFARQARYLVMLEDDAWWCSAYALDISCVDSQSKQII